MVLFDWERKKVDVTTEDDDEHFKYNADARKHRFDKGTRWKDAFVILCAGFALISDGYQNNLMSMLNKVFSLQFPKEYTSEMLTNISNASLIATIIGQVTVGVVCDYIGRKAAVIGGTFFLVIGSLVALTAHGSPHTILTWIRYCRGIIGYGIGAEYPALSTLASEAANASVKRRGRAFVLVTNLPLSFGGPFALIVFLIVQAICKNHYTGIWKLMFAIGCFWPLAVLPFRLIATLELYKRSAVKRKVPYWLAIKFYWMRLVGISMAWFLYDFVTFPNGIFSAQIISNVIPKEQNKDLRKIAEWNLLLGVLAIPGVFIGAFLIDIIGRKWTMMIGFAGYIVFGLIVGCAYDLLLKHTAGFIVLYGFFMSSGNLGPGDCLGTVSLELFATPIRGTAYGICAAIGKVGAVVGTQAFNPIQKNLGKKWTFIIAAICGLAGVIVSLLFVPNLNDKNNDLMEEDIRFKNYCIQHGCSKDIFGTNEALTHDEKLFNNEIDDDDLSSDKVEVVNEDSDEGKVEVINEHSDEYTRKAHDS